MSDEKKPANTLHDLVKLSCDIKQTLVETMGEITQETEELLLHLEEIIPNKADAYRFITQDLEHEAELWKKRAKEFDRIAKSLETHAQKMKDAIKFACIQMQIDELKGNDFTWKLQRAKSKVIIEDPELVPGIFKEIVQTTNIKKDEISKAWSEHDQPVPGTRLEESLYVKPYPNVRK